MSGTAAELGKPDFIGIGMMRAGTSWLFDQLRSHPGAWLPPRKELHFFDGYCSFAGTARKFASILVPQDQLEEPAGREQPADELLWDRMDGATADELVRIRHDLAFFAKALLSNGAGQMLRRQADRPETSPPSDLIRRADLEWYSRLFVADDLVCGEITPAYAELSKREVRRILRTFPATRFVLILRDPVERAVSHMSLVVQKDLTGPVADISPDFHAMIDGIPAIISKSRVSTVRDNRLSIVPPERMLVLDFAALRDRPNETRERVPRFLSLDPALYRVDPALNRKESLAKFEPPADVTERLATVLAPERDLYREIGGQG